MDPIGRPAMEISADVVMFMQRLGLTITGIGNQLQVSRVTLYRKFPWLARRLHYANDEELTYAIRRILRASPKGGEVYVMGALKSMNIDAPRKKIREILEVEDLERHVRSTRGIHRRTYTVKGPNYLW